MKLGEAMYADAQKNAGGPGGPGGDAGPSAGAPKDDVVDAEFTEVDDDKNKKKSA
jgi:molecular chaperone DnaK